jgi:hypothetical protein
MKQQIKNSRKKPGSIVWHNNELKMITSQNVGPNHVILNNIKKVKKSGIRLARIGDSVSFKDLSVLPARCATQNDMHITYFLNNGIVGTDKDLYPDSDGSDYSHFVRS